jgi:hypothetical protein
MISGSLNFLEPSGLLQAYNGTALRLPFYLLVTWSSVSCVFFKQAPKFCLSSDKLVAFYADANSMDVEGSKEFTWQYNSVIMSS